MHNALVAITGFDDTLAGDIDGESGLLLSVPNPASIQWGPL